LGVGGKDRVHCRVGNEKGSGGGGAQQSRELGLLNWELAGSYSTTRGLGEGTAVGIGNQTFGIGLESGLEAGSQEL